MAKAIMNEFDAGSGNSYKTAETETSGMYESSHKNIISGLLMMLPSDS